MEILGDDVEIEVDNSIGNKIELRVGTKDGSSEVIDCGDLEISPATVASSVGNVVGTCDGADVSSRLLAFCFDIVDLPS